MNRLRYRIAAVVILQVLVILAVMVLLLSYQLSDVGRNAENEFEKLGRQSRDASIKELSGLSQSYVQDRAQALAAVIASYLSNKSLDKALQEDFFRELSVQPVGDMGYSALVGRNLTILLHKEQSLEGYDFAPERDSQPEIYNIVSEARATGKAGGYYTWIEPDGSSNRKFLHMVKVDHPLEPMIAVTVYVDEFREPMQRLTSFFAEYDNKGFAETAKSSLKTGIIAAVILFIVSTIITIISSSVMTGSIEQLESRARKLGEGSQAAEKKDSIEIISAVLEMLDENRRASQKKLEHFNNRLKKQVESKTVEMRTFIKDLEKTKAALLNMMEDIVEANENLKELDKAKSDFLNMVSHELKTPLTAMNAHLEVLDDMQENLDKQQLLSLDAIKRNVNQLRMLIENILEIARIESGKFQLNNEKVDVNRTVRDVVSNLRILAENKHVKLNMKLARLPFVETDQSRLREVLNNLVSNAIKFTEKGSITVQTSLKKDHFQVRVTDTGIGIPEDKMNNLFTKFYQVDASLSRKYGGSGLGLSITKQLIELQGGRIGVKSRVGHGSTFCFQLPIKGGKK